ncbi:MAG TPA: hypothetical protein VGN20_12100 [Mucilaginibacter sp.]|jgi:hypothetical protein
MKNNFDHEFKPGDLVVVKNNKEIVYKLLYIIGSYGNCKDQVGTKKHVRLSTLTKLNVANS